MRARGLALGAVIAALAAAGCGGDEPAPFKEVKKPATTTSSATPSVPSGSEDPLAELSTDQRKALAALVTAQADLSERGDAVASAGTDADKLVERVDEGFAAPSGSAPDVRRLAVALTSFAAATEAIAANTDLLPQLSTQLQLRYAALAKKRPTVAAHVLDVKEKVDTVIRALPGLRTKIDDAASNVREQLSAVELDAGRLGDAIEAGAESTTSALNGVNQAVDLGVRTLAESA
jgi:hypothetical protein